MKALLLIALIIYTSLSLIHRSKRYNQIPSPTNKTKIHIHNPTEPTDNPTNPIRDLNPKDTNLLTHPTPNKTNNQYNTHAQYEQNKIILGLTM